MVEILLILLSYVLGSVSTGVLAGRAFFVVPAEAHRQVLRERALRLVRNRCWARHFELYESGDTE